MNDNPNILAEAALLEFEQRLSKWEEKKKALDDEKIEIYKIKQAVKEVCTHPSTKKVDDFDYHRREDWTVVVCTFCDKELEIY